MQIKILASGSSGNCYLLDNGEDRLLIEAGIRFKRIQEGLDFATAKLSGCLISHAHMDHAISIEKLLHIGVDCYMSQGTADALKCNGHTTHIVEHRIPFDVGAWHILPFSVEHDVDGALGFLLTSGDEKILYATDTSYLKYIFSGLTRVMIECNYSLDILRENVSGGDIPLAHKNRVMRSHMSLDTLIEFFKANDLSRLKEVYLLHLSNENSDAELFKETIEGITGVPVYIGG